VKCSVGDSVDGAVVQFEQFFHHRQHYENLYVWTPNDALHSIPLPLLQSSDTADKSHISVVEQNNIAQSSLHETVGFRHQPFFCD